jgi:membrane-associated protease RseP (regulator of RpoE activity)
MASIEVYLLYIVPALALYALLVVALYRKGLIGEGKPAALLLGFILMVKTLRGRGLIDRVGRRFRRFWNVFGDVGIVLGFVGMIVMFLILAWGAYRVSGIPPSSRPGLSEDLAIPGLNPLLPLGYGLFALIVAVVLHELCHGVLARANNIGVKSLGVLLMVIPLGAFVEQDEKEMNAAPARQRDRVAAAGIMANFVLAILFLLIMGALLTTSVHAKADGVGVLSIFPGTPAANTSEASQLGSSGLVPGDIITEFNGTACPTYIPLEDEIHKTAPGTVVPITWYSQAAGGLVSANITMAAAIHFPSAFTDPSAIPSNLSFLGIGETLISPSMMVSVLADGPAAPGTGALLGTNDFYASSALFLALPTTNEMPVQGPVAQFYSVSGPLGAIGSSNGWIVINTLYWLVWVNVILGIFNALPAVPLDGGFLFRDVVGEFFHKLKPVWTKERRDAVTGGLSTAITLTVLALILWELFAP